MDGLTFFGASSGAAFSHGFNGFLSCFVSAGMAYGGTEMLGLTTAECKHPRKVMPLGAMLVIGRIVVCYLLPLFILGLVLSPSAFEIPEFARLQIVSPFVVAVDLAGLPALGHFINVVLLLSVFSMANASVFATSRAMTSICKKGMGPEQLSRLSKRGVPWNALLVVFGVSQLAWIGFAKDGERIFEWLLSVASASNYFTVSLKARLEGLGMVQGNTNHFVNSGQASASAISVCATPCANKAVASTSSPGEVPWASTGATLPSS